MPSRPNASRVFHRSLTQPIPQAAFARGATITDTSGKVYLDASSGAAVSSLGHSHPAVIEAVKAQLDRMAFAHNSFLTSEPAERLAAMLSDKAPGGAWRVYFLSGGSEATEAALKLARQLQVERGQASRDTLVSRRFSYHGNTLGALAVSGRASSLALYGPLLTTNVRRVDPCYAYRCREEGESLEDYGLRAARSLETELEALGPERAICFIAETVSGATLGCVPPTPGYFKEIRRICDAHGVFMVLDEVMCGMGRCGTLFACEQDGVVPDMITIAKGLGGGYQPIGALMVREELVEELERGSGSFSHGHTYVAHAAACAAGVAVQEALDREGLVERVARLAPVLRRRLVETFGEHPNVGDIRGRGFFQAVELVADRDSKEPFPAEARLAARIKAQALRNGLICYPFAGNVDGTRGDHMLLAPPFIFTEAQIDQTCETLRRSLDEVLAETKS